MKARPSFPLWRLLLAVGLSVVALGLGASCRRPPPKTHAPITLSDCHPRGVTDDARCGVLRVPEDRATGQGRTFELHVVVLPALAQSSAPDPVFFLAGGPGQGAAALASNILPMVEKLHRGHDIVLVDQRGTGKSSPLSCEGSEDAGLQERLGEAIDTGALSACLARYQDAGIDPARFTTSIAMDDLDEVRAALGYERINLYGLSYGTRAALDYARRHPEHVRTLVLDGVAPPSMSLLLSEAEDAERAFHKVFQACAEDTACNRSYPHLQASFHELLARLQSKPAVTTVADPITGAPTELRITRASFVSNLHGILYSPEISALLPLVIDRASHGDFAPFVAQAVGTSAMGESISQGMFFSVVCAEDAPAATPTALAAHTQGTLLGPDYAGALLQACAFWPKAEIPAAYHAPVQSNVPTLLLSGELDPVTPPARAQEAATALSRATLLTVPGTGHNTSLTGCVPQLVRSFVEDQGPQRIDAGCLSSVHRPPFFVTFAGPPP